MREHERIAGVGLAPGDAVPIPVTRHRQRVDREHRPAGRTQRGDEQTAAGLYRHGNQLFAVVAVLGQHAEQLGEAGHVVTDPQLRQRLALVINQRDVVVIVGPVDPAEHSHPRSPLAG